MLEKKDRKIESMSEKEYLEKIYNQNEEIIKVLKYMSKWGVPNSYVESAELKNEGK